MNGPPSQALATHLINQTLSSLSVLETLNIISRDDASQIRSRLPNPYGPFPSLEPASSIHQSFSQLSVTSVSPPRQQISPQPATPQAHTQQNMSLVPALPPRGAAKEVRARALWDYSGTVSEVKTPELTCKEPDDLRFQANDTIIIDEEGECCAHIAS